jgi:Cytochrome c7 and related cytochrome c
MARRGDNSLTRTLLSATLTLILVGLVALVFRVGAQGQPPQPLAFSHRLHARDRSIPCLQCHTYARRGPVAGIPSVQRCAQCHLTIAKERPEIVKLLKYWEDKEPIPWLRVHDLPDYVRFTHKRHVLAGVTCQTCHGDVAGMDAAVQTAPLTMGWCLGCHKERQAPTDCLACHY